jgi:hypothetical protein
MQVRSDSPVLRFVHELEQPDPVPITIEGSVVRSYDPLRDSPLAGNGVVFYRGPYAPPRIRRRLIAWIRWY